MRGDVAIWSLPRRALGRLAEIVFLGEVGGALGLFPGFHAAFFGEHLLFYLLMSLGCSMLYDLIEIAVRPDLSLSPCVEKSPELPLGDGK